jgi:transposase-like protein
MLSYLGVIGIMEKQDFTTEFKKQCVASYLNRGKRTLGQVSTELGIASSSLSRWVKDTNINGTTSAKTNDNNSMRMRQLEKENHQQRLEIEFLKKISVYLAKEIPQQFKKL